MSVRTIEVEVVNGVVRPAGSEKFPAEAQGFLTLFDNSQSSPESRDGLSSFLSSPDVPLTAEQFRSSMEGDYWDQ
jgi:hypothetical protein